MRNIYTNDTIIEIIHNQYFVDTCCICSSIFWNPVYRSQIYSKFQHAYTVGSMFVFDLPVFTFA